MGPVEERSLKGPFKVSRIAPRFSSFPAVARCGKTNPRPVVATTKPSGATLPRSAGFFFPSFDSFQRFRESLIVDIVYNARPSPPIANPQYVESEQYCGAGVRNLLMGFPCTKGGRT